MTEQYTDWRTRPRRPRPTIYPDHAAHYRLVHIGGDSWRLMRGEESMGFLAYEISTRRVVDELNRLHAENEAYEDYDD